MLIKGKVQDFIFHSTSIHCCNILATVLISVKPAYNASRKSAILILTAPEHKLDIHIYFPTADQSISHDPQTLFHLSISLVTSELRLSSITIIDDAHLLPNLLSLVVRKISGRIVQNMIQVPKLACLLLLAFRIK